jgi:hypothetical protein
VFFSAQDIMMHAPARTHATPSRWAILAIGAALALALVAGCQSKPGADAKAGVKATYDEQSGKLAEIAVDANKDGRPDTWGRMDGTRVRVIEVDKDRDGKPDRWEYYLPDGRLEKVGTSSARSGKADTFYFQDGTGQLAKIQRGAADGRIRKTEFYERGTLVRAEEDTDADGKVDRWATYANGRLASVAFDVDKSGVPTRRLVYEADGTVRLEGGPESAPAPAARK